MAIEVPFGTSTALILLSAKEAHARIRAGLAMDAAIGAMMKRRQVNRLMNPDVPEPSAWRVVAEQLGIEVPAGAGGGGGTSAVDGERNGAKNREI